MTKASKVPKEKLEKVKELLANISLEQLKQGDDFTEIAYTKVEFGYLYTLEDKHQALFKVVTDKKTFYFAVQGDNLMRLSDAFDENTFQKTVQQTMALHGDWK